MKEDGGPAYPFVYEQVSNSTDNSIFFSNPGMTLRDYFAAAALQDAARICASRMNAAPASALAGYIAQYAYEIADAMIAEREKK